MNCLLHKMSIKVNNNRRRVVITGLGCVSPIGNSIAELWSSLLSGKSGVAAITRFDASKLTTRFAAEVKDFNAQGYLSVKEARHMDLFVQYGLVAGMQAITDSGLLITNFNADRIGVMVGSGIGGLPFIEENHNELLNRGHRRVSPFFIPGTIVNMVAGQLSIRFGLRGPNLAMATACATGLHCVGLAARLIQYGDADAMLAGSSESTVSPLGISGFNAARALSTRNEDPTTASRPWDRDRDGFVLGEGSGVLMLEEYEHAKRRGANVYAEILGFAANSDAHHVTAPLEDGSGAERCMRAALLDACTDGSDIDYINAHGTSTGLGDLAETIAIKRTFNQHAKKLIVNSTKSMTGHLLGGAGGLESVITALAIQRQTSPPTTNLLNPDPDCDLDYCANAARDVKIKKAIKNAFGFGGTNGSLVFGRI